MRNTQSFVLAGAIIGAVATARKMARQGRAISFRGKVALVTGGGRGLGLVLARQLADEGASVAICARNENELSLAREELRARGAKAIAVRCDVTKRKDVEAMLETVRRELGAIDILINNAGTIQVGPMDEMTIEDYEYALRVHFWGPLFTMLGVLPEMRQRGSGRIVNISSIGGKIGVSHLLPYSASKFALVGFSQGLRGALAQDGIYVTTAYPGLMRTGSPRHASFKGRHRKEYAWFSIADSLPLLTVSASRAAQRILEACRYGDAQVTVPLLTTVAVKLNELFPELSSDLMSFAERLLPRPGGIGAAVRSGAKSESWLAPSLLTKLSDRAAIRNNELAPERVERSSFRLYPEWDSY